MKILFIPILLIITIIGCGNHRDRHSGGKNKENTPVVNDQNDTLGMSYDGTIVYDNSIGTKALKSNEPTQINIYFENSGSMNGFINQVSEYQDAIQNMLAWLEYYYNVENIKLHYINRSIINMQKPDNETLLNFAQYMLSPQQFKSHGNGASTDLNSIVDMILNQTDNNTISILLSDNIYSISGAKTVPVLLSECKNRTLQAFLNKSKDLQNKHRQSMSTTIIQLYSQFNGGYWDYQHPTGQASQTLNCKRPYYMCVIGENSLVGTFNNKFDVTKMNGYKNRYVLTDISNLNPVCSVLINTYKTGKFKKVDDTTIRDAKIDSHKHVFSFAIAIDLKGVPLSDDEKCNINLFEVSNGYVVDEVIKIKNASIAPIDNNSCQNCTHIVKISTTNTQTPSFTFSMKRQLPDWIVSCSSENDTHIDKDINEQSKTFGLLYFVNGIKESYDKGQEEYFSISITINR